MSEDTTATEDADRIDPLQKSIDTLNWAEVESWVNTNGTPELVGIVERCRRSRVLIQQWSSAERLRKRDEFFGNLLKLLDGKAEPEVLSEVGRLVNGARLFERAYSEIQDALRQAEFSKLRQDEQLWAWVGMLHSFSLELKEHLERHFRTTKVLVDPSALQILDQEGIPFNPDSAWGLIVESVSGSLLMLGHRGKLFDKDGVLVLPPLIQFNTENTHMAKVASLLAASWNVLERAEERWRWWGGELRLERQSAEVDGSPREIDRLIYEHEFNGVEVLNFIANERLTRFVHQARNDVEARLGEAFAASDEKLAVPLMPKSVLTREEAISAYALSSLLRFDVLQDSHEYAGLTFPEWLRGYARIQQVAIDARIEGREIGGIYSISREALVESVRQVGLSASKAQLLLNHLSFKRGSADLFDTPLLRSSDGLVHLIVPIIAEFSIPLLILSQLSRLKKNIGRKGTGLETFVQTRLGALGVQCSGVKFKVENDEYQYDAVFVLDDVLFVFECKNRSIPGVSSRRLYEFVRDLAGHLEQLDRLVDAANQYPEKIRERLGGNVTWSRVVGGVLYGLPWCLGVVDGRFVNDSSALIRFFQDRWMLMPPPKNCTPQVEEIWKKTLGAIWSSQIPSAADLEKQLAEPWQVKVLKGEVGSHSPDVPLSKNMFFSRPRLIRMPPSLERMLRSLGLQGEELKQLVAAYLPEEVPGPA